MAFKAIKTALLSAAVLISGAAGVAYAAGGSTFDYEMKHPHWHFNGMFGQYDREAMQRGYQVYREVCASCHALEHLSFRHLGDKGGPFYDAEYPNPSDNPMVKGLAADWDTIEYVDADSGDVETRTGIPADAFPDIYPNDAAARAGNGGALPPDLSVIIKARNDGANYVYNLLTAYDEKMPKDMKMGTGQYFNPVMEGGAIAMAAPLTDGQVEYEGPNAPEATVDQMSMDVVEFLAWAADPKMEQRKRVGFGTLIYLFFFSILLYLSYKRVWKSVKH